MRFGLVRRERDVPARLQQKFALAAAEAVRRAARGDEHSEDAAFDLQRRGHERAQADPRQLLGKGKARISDVGFVHQHALGAAPQAVRVYGDARLLRYAEFSRQRGAARADTGHA